MSALAGVVLAAGLGTRLQPLTALRPKPLVPVGGRPLLEVALDALAAIDARPVAINCFHLGEQLPAALAHRAEALYFLQESALQGTGGGIRGLARLLPRTTLAVVNGDALFGFDLAPALARHRASGAMATLVLRPPAPDEPYGRVGVDPSGRLQRIAEVEGLRPDAPDLRWGVFTGVQFVEPELVDALPPEGACDVLRTAYARRMREGAATCGVFVDGEATWIDVGTPERYRAANFAVLEGRVAVPGLPPADERGRRIHPEARVAAGANLEGPCLVLAGAHVDAGARLGPRCVVAEGATITSDADLEACVVWAGVVVSGRHREAVLTGQSSS